MLERLAIWFVCIITLVSLSPPAQAWSAFGHEVIAQIALPQLTPKARERLEKLIAIDAEENREVEFKATPDLAGWSVWADYLRLEAPVTRPWHYVDIEIDDQGSIEAACSSKTRTFHSALINGQTPISLSPNPSMAKQPVSQDISKFCLTDKLYDFGKEAMDPSTSQGEKIVALKFLINLIGDVHQPLRTADRHDGSGECTAVQFANAETGVTLFSYWDSVIVRQLGNNPAEAVAKVDAILARGKNKTIPLGDNELSRQELVSGGAWAERWALESHRIAKLVAYKVAGRSSCGARQTLTQLDDSYQTIAIDSAALQLSQAGARIARVLNLVLDPSYDGVKPS